MKRFTLVSLCFIVSTAGASVAAETPKPMSEAETLLAAIDEPLTMQAIADAGLTETMAIGRLDDAEARRYIRLRAVSALGYFRTPTARARVEAAATKDADLEVRIQAVTTLARAFGAGDVTGVIALLSSLRRAAPERLTQAIDAELRLLEPRAPVSPASGSPLNR